MNRRELERTGWKESEISFGARGIGGNFGEADVYASVPSER